jgi:phytoene/squalene synthetase
MSAASINAHPEPTIAVASNGASQADVKSAYEYCGRLARSHYENFTIASWLMPRAIRPSMHAIYAYARMADDFADEEHDAGKLDEWERELDLCYAGTPRHPVFVALADTVLRYDVPREPFADLLVANPVGRLVLYLFGYRDAERQHLSDLVCSGLQLANFWQDVAVDVEKNRIYFPRSDMRDFGVTADALEQRVATPEFLALMRHEVGVARDLLRRGAELHRMVDRRLSRDILMFAGGGLAILRAIERVGYDVFNRRPQLTKLDYLKLGVSALRGRIPA